MKYIKTNTATKSVTSSNLSTSKAEIVCQQLPQEGIDIGTPSRSGIYISSIKDAVKIFKKEMKKAQHLQNWSLRFDSKSIDSQEYQVLVLNNERREVKSTAFAKWKRGFYCQRNKEF